jgi:hypothetical protein
MGVRKRSIASCDLMRIRESDLEWREVDGRVLVLDLRTARYLAISPTGRKLWDALVEGATHSELVERLMSAHGLERARAEADVDSFVRQLDERGLIAREDPLDSD